MGPDKGAGRASTQTRKRAGIGGVEWETVGQVPLEKYLAADLVASWPTMLG
jgi:hypothetical protein